MSAVLDNKSLDDYINELKKSQPGNSTVRSRRSGSGSSRRFPNRAAPYAAAKLGYYVAQRGRLPSIETGTKIFVSNLDYDVSDDDIKELFSELGDLKRHGVHFDRSGRSKGTAEVVFSRRADAVTAVKKYNNVQLDGKRMKLEIVGTNISTPGVAPAGNGAIRNSNGFFRSGQGRRRSFGRPGGRGQGSWRGRGNGSNQGRGHRQKLSAEDLDTDLEKYHAEAMQLN